MDMEHFMIGMLLFVCLGLSVAVMILMAERDGAEERARYWEAFARKLPR